MIEYGRQLFTKLRLWHMQKFLKENTMVFALISPGGGGKTYFAKQLDFIGFRKVVSCTTRKKRRGELEGVDYYFVSDDNFYCDEKLESTYFNNARYGISKREIKGKLEKYKRVVVVVEKNGVDSLRQIYGDKLRVIYLHNPEERLIKRMRARGDSKKEIGTRLKIMKSEEKDYIELADVIFDGDWDTSKRAIIDYMLSVKSENELEKKYIFNTSLYATHSAHLEYSKEIIQVYLPTKSSAEERIRKVGNVYERTIKTTTKCKELRKEVTVPATQREFDIAMCSCLPYVKKMRTTVFIPSEKGLFIKAEIDTFVGLLFRTVEFEFYSNRHKREVMNSKEWLSFGWLGEDITHDSKYKNKNIAKLFLS